MCLSHQFWTEIFGIGIFEPFSFRVNSQNLYIYLTPLKQNILQIPFREKFTVQLITALQGDH